MSSPLNGPLEVGVRVLMVLTEVFPADLDLNRLVLLDHGLLHSADFGGPQSLHPPLPIRTGELGVKRQTIEDGLQVMIRAGLAQIDVGDDGIRFRAGEAAEGFVALLATPYAAELHDRSRWVVEHFSDLDESTLREQLRQASSHWAEEFEHRPSDEIGTT